MADSAAANFVLAVFSICLQAATVLVFLPKRNRDVFLEAATGPALCRYSAVIKTVRSINVGSELFSGAPGTNPRTEGCRSVQRWATIVPAPLLQQLMHHASLSTTMRFYVEIEAKSTIEKVRRHLKKYQQVTEKGDWRILNR